MNIETVEENPNQSTVQKKRHRHRKKLLYASILKQMEFYFSDASLSKDRYLSQLIMTDPFVPIDIFLSFNKIKALTEKSIDIAKALSESNLLEISEDGTKVKRITPLVPYDADARTIYVESLPAAADMKWVTEVFQAYGNVAYVSLPKFHKSNKIKGFAFVEFQSPAEAKKCVEAFEAMGCKLPSSIKAEELSSCTNTQTDASEQDDKKNDGSNSNSEKDVKECESESSPPAKKIKIDDKEISNREDGIADENIPLELSTPHDNTAEFSEGASELENSGPPDENEKTTKLPRKRKKKDKKKLHKDIGKRGLEGAVKGLQILSKCEWKVLRNKYLNMQRKHMKVLKQVLRTQHTLPQSRGPVQSSGLPDSEQFSEDQDSKGTLSQPPEIPFVEGVIVLARLAEPCLDVKNLKQSTKANVHVRFVDVKEGSFDVYIRMDENKFAKQLTSSGIFPEARILAGEEEKLYWEELRRQHSGRSSSKRKMRGRDRLIKKAQQFVASGASLTQTGRHIRFDD